MIDLLARVLIGAAVGAFAAAMVYSIVTKDNLSEKIKECLSEQELENAVSAKVREVERNNGTITLDVLDRMGDYKRTTLYGDEISDDVTVGLTVAL